MYLQEVPKIRVPQSAEVIRIPDAIEIRRSDFGCSTLIVIDPRSDFADQMLGALQEMTGHYPDLVPVPDLLHAFVYMHDPPEDHAALGAILGGVTLFLDP